MYDAVGIQVLCVWQTNQLHCAVLGGVQVHA
jgi:hypothetical protein